ncbi:MAG: Lrp/AsnC family transcriptional regulator [Gammaproteobacteria bacterium]|nr:Lrp/AsnC family transcriptional regulator [Gammaproteobacteria bacterium]
MGLTDPLEISFINKYQGGFPVCEQPFLDVALELGTDETTLISIIQKLLTDGWLSRFGPLYDAKQMGGGLTLAALSVAEDQFDKITSIVNAFDEVAHNYRREHKLNMWFVLATETEQAIQNVISDIESKTGLKVFNCPKLQEFYVGLKLHIDSKGQVDTVPMDVNRDKLAYSSMAPVAPNTFERKIIAASQAGLPLVSKPYELLARQLDSDTKSIMNSFDALLKNGTMRRIGAVPNHYKLGLRGNGMTVWDVPDELVSEIGEKIGSMGFVSHCYQRPRHLPDWPYNLFAMVHGADKDQAINKLQEMEAELYPYNFRHDVLFSSAILKKSGLRILR